MLYSSIQVAFSVPILLLTTGAAAFAAETPAKPLDPLADNLLLDGDLRFEQPAEKGKPPKVILPTPRYWQLRAGEKKLEGQELPFDAAVKDAGDCSIRLDGAGGKLVFLRSGWADTNPHMRHGWAYTAAVRLKLENVKGKVWVEVGYSWGKVKSKELSGTLDWTSVPLDFILDRNTNLLQEITVHFEGTGKVWIGGLALRMKDADAFRWWAGWNGGRPTARLSEPAGTDERAGVLPPLPPEQLDAYGGLKEVKSRATGAFRCEKIGGKWWLITPEGHGFFKTAMFVPSFPTYPNHNALLERIGGRDAWCVQTVRRLESWGFNAIEWGPGYVMDAARGTFGKAPPEIAGKSQPYTANVRFELCTDPARNGGVKVPVVDWGWQRFPDVFSAEFAQAVENYGTPGQQGSHFQPRPDDPWLIGYQLADEPPWYGPGVWYGSLTDGFHGLPATAPGKQRWLAMLKEKHGRIEALNKAWVSDFDSWEAFAAAAAAELPRSKASIADRRTFMGLVAERWYALAAERVRKYDTKHLMLGGNATRLYPEVVAAEAKHADVLCASLYGLAGIYRPHPDFRHFVNDQVNAWTGKPILIGYLSGEEDAGGLPGIRCAETAAQRGQAYRAFLREAAANDACVGTFWWMYQSWPEPNTEGYTKSWGIVTPDNRAYLDLLPYVQQANHAAYRYRLGREGDSPVLAETKTGTVPKDQPLEPPTLWQPSHRWLLLSRQVVFALRDVPRGTEACEIELSPADGAGGAKPQTLSVRPVKDGRCTHAQKLAPGAWQWRARSVREGKPSEWSLPFAFEVAQPDEAAAFQRIQKAINDGEAWKPTVVQDGPQRVAVECRANLKAGGAVVPVTTETPKGQKVRRVELACRLPQPLVLKRGVQYSFRATMRADTEAAAFPLLTVGLRHGYKVTEDYSPIDKGWLVQRGLSEGRVTPVRTTFRLPKDMAAESLSVRLDDCRGKVEILSLELVPETEYENGTALLDDYRAIVEEFRRTKHVSEP
jgi:hypothetical protein